MGKPTCSKPELHPCQKNSAFYRLTREAGFDKLMNGWNFRNNQFSEERRAFMKKNFGTFLVPMVAFALVLGTGTGWAALVPISDAGFETPGAAAGGTGSLSATAWVVSSAGGVFYPNSVTEYSQPVPEGHQVGFVNSGVINQILTATLQANSVYTLSGYIGNRSDFGFNSATVALFVGNSGNTSFTQLGSLVITAPSAGTFATWSFDYTSPSSIPGTETGDLVISLGGPNSGSQVNYDEISLSYVPEPVNMALAMFGILAVGGTAGRRWLTSRKNAFQSVSVSS